MWSGDSKDSLGALPSSQAIVLSCVPITGTDSNDKALLRYRSWDWVSERALFHLVNNLGLHSGGERVKLRAGAPAHTSPCAPTWLPSIPALPPGILLLNHTSPHGN